MNSVIGVTGTIGAGKDTVAKFFINKGFNHYSLSDEIRRVADEQGLARNNRDDLVRLANKLRKEQGYGVLAKLVLNQLKLPAVVTSIRHPEEVRVLKGNLDNFILISVDAPTELRHDRSVKRKREGGAEESLEEFIEKEKREMWGNNEAQQIGKVMEVSDVSIINDGDINNLYNKLKEYDI